MKKENNQQNEDALVEQNAPLKNTDQAFVQVGKDGHPVFPENQGTSDDTERKSEESRQHS